MATTTPKTKTKTEHDSMLADMIRENIKTAEDSLDLALRDLEQAAGIAISAKQTLTAEERLEILKKARDLRNFAGFIIDRIESMERAALN